MSTNTFNWQVEGLRFGQRPVSICIDNTFLEGREILLPLPPSENKRIEPRFRSKGFKNTAEYSSWLNYASHELKAGRYTQIENEVVVCINTIFPDLRKRDAQNYEKPLFDAMTQSECVYSDDSKVKFHTNSTLIVKDMRLILAYVFPFSDFIKTDFFGKISVNAEYVGSIIGKGGIKR